MLRTAERRTSSPADDLLDRTGIIAASLPHARRSTEDTQPLPALVPFAGDGAALLARPARRPRSTRRRVRAWLAGLGAVALLALGWLAGGLSSGPFDGTDNTADNVAAPAAVAPAPAPAPAPEPAPPAAPVTVYVPVPAHQPPVARHETTRPTTSRSSAPEHKTVTQPVDQDEARADTTPAAAAAKSEAAAEVDRYLARWKPWIDLANRMSGRH